jgi:two-component system sensor histidine kinase TctE
VPRPAPGLSLKRQLLLWLLLPQGLLWLVSGVLAYRIALSYAEKAIDQSLTQSVLSLARQVKPMGSGLLVDFPRAAQDIIEQDPTDRVSYMVSSPPGQFVLGNGKLPAPPGGDRLQQPKVPLLYDALVDGKPVRVAMLELNYGEAEAPQRLRVQLAKSLTVQQRIARELVADMLLPLLLLGSLLGVLITLGVSRGLQPLKKLEALLGDRRRRVSALAPIEMTQAPQEVYSLADAVNQLLATVQRNVHQEKRFLSDAAHQLRTPLAGLISQTELALQEQDPVALRERLGKVHAASLRSAHLVHQMLSLARTEAAVKLSALDVAMLAREVAREWTPRALGQGIDLGFEGLEHLRVQGESLLLREAMSNLIDNAVHYAGRGATVTLRVALAAQPQGTALIEVEDNGPGLAQADLPRALERFWRASEVPGGCGLGLAIVEGIAQRHGGSVQVVQVQPQGLRVCISLPALA